MLLIRSALFNLFLAAWTILLGTVALPLTLFPGKLSYTLGKVWSGGLIIALRIICGLTYRIEGSENLPSSACILASKHQSAWDTPIFLWLLDGPAYVLKKELLQLPFYGWHLKHMGMIEVDRKGGASALKSMLHATAKRLQSGHSVVIFPEGTRVKPNEKGTYHSGIAAIYSHNQAPVIPVALNSGLFWGKGAFLKRPGIITLQYLPPLQAGMKKAEFMVKLEETIEGATQKLVQAAV